MGEIPRIVGTDAEGTDGKGAGIVVSSLLPADDMVNQMTTALLPWLSDETEFAKLRLNAEERASVFSMDRLSQLYLSIFKEKMPQKWGKEPITMRTQEDASNV
ncbi:hypothetical protein [Paracoccus sp. (in: a-proteobacteria)]|uniref:hypothetical protein n=1 Tax=Paracoccus sp. TaxID=267 RepID=UPI002AFEB58F|nr:hypothetical protein [Paracoccus sp. (in: a-proteobacteria)]